MSQNAGFAPSNFPGGFVQTLTGDMGGPVPPTGGNINIITNVAGDNSGSSIEFTGNPGTSTLTLNVTDADDNTLIGRSAGNATLSGSDNTGLGFEALSGLTTGLFNTGIGSQALLNLTSGSNNVAIGAESLGNLVSGSGNVVVGESSGLNYTGAESDNILLDNDGVLGDSKAIRIGEQGFHTTAFMAGITGVTVSNAEIVTINSVTGQLGVAAGGGTPIDTITGNDGVPESPSAGNFNIITANATPKFLGSAATETLDFGITNLVLGSSLPALTIGSQNSGLGDGVLAATTSGIGNAALGFQALKAVNSGSANIGIGQSALTTLTTGSHNIGIGLDALEFLLTGADNTVVGDSSGTAYTGAEANNILIGANVPGILGESNVIRVGQSNTSGIQLTTADHRQLHNFGTHNIFLGDNAGNFTLAGADDNTGIGYHALTSVTSSTQNTCVGSGAGASIQDSQYNTLVGYNAGTAIVTSALGPGAGGYNTAVGSQALVANTTGYENTVLGYAAFFRNTTGAGNIAIGFEAGGVLGTFTGDDNILIGTTVGSALATNESHNILIGNNVGVTTDNNTIRIGRTSAPNPILKCFIAGIDGVNVGSTATVVTEASNQLGTATIQGGTGINVSAGANTITISATGTTNLTYTNVNATPYVVLATDEYLSVDTSALAITVQLPNAATSGRVFIIKDRTGAAATRNITVTTVGGAVNIDGATTYVMNNNFQSIQVIGNGSTYEIF